MTEPDFTNMPFGLSQAIDVTVYGFGDRSVVRGVAQLQHHRSGAPAHRRYRGHVR